jgi:hypothetical protein
MWQDWADGCIEIASKYDVAVLKLAFSNQFAETFVDALNFYSIIFP